MMLALAKDGLRKEKGARWIAWSDRGLGTGGHIIASSIQGRGGVDGFF
jgi:hypothetical protein